MLTCADIKLQIVYLSYNLRCEIKKYEQLLTKWPLYIMYGNNVPFVTNYDVISPMGMLIMHILTIIMHIYKTRSRGFRKIQFTWLKFDLAILWGGFFYYWHFFPYRVFFWLLGHSSQCSCYLTMYGEKIQ